MKTLLSALAIAVALTLVPGAARADAAAECAAKAVDKNGKPLAGAAKDSFVKKCVKDAGGKSDCAARAVDKNGKPLAGAAKDSFMKKCEKDAAAKK